MEYSTQLNKQWVRKGGDVYQLSKGALGQKLSYQDFKSIYQPQGLNIDIIPQYKEPAPTAPTQYKSAEEFYAARDARVSKPIRPKPEQITAPVTALKPSPVVSSGPIADVQKVFGQEWQPSPIFQEKGLIDKGIVGAVRIKGKPTVFTIGPGGTAIRTPEQFKSLFGTLNQEGIVGEVTPEQAKALGITETGDIITTSDSIRDKEAQEELDKLEEDEKKKLDDETEIDRLTREKKIRDLRIELGLDPDTGGPLAKPERPSLESDFEALRAEHGVGVLEQQINTIETQIQDAEASLRKGMYDVEGKLQPMELIGTEQRELARQGQEKIDTMVRRKNQLIAELNTKNTLVTNIMNLKQTDYANAVTEYNTAFNQNLQLISIIEGRETEERDIASANLGVITTMMKDSGTTWDELGDDLKAQVSSLEAQSGLPQGVIQSFMNETPDADLLTTTTSYDAAGNQIVSFIYKDENGKPGIVETVYTGGKKDEGGNGPSKWDEARSIIGANPDASYEQLESHLRENTKLSDSDIGVLLREAGKSKTVESELALDDNKLRQIAFSSIIDNPGQEKEVIDTFKESKLSITDPDTGKTTKYQLGSDQIKRLHEIVNEDQTAQLIINNPGKYRIGDKGVYEIKKGWRKDKLIYEF